MIMLKAASEVAVMREAGRVVARTLAAVAAAARPGVRLSDLDQLACEILAKHGAKPSFLGYHPVWAPVPYPAVICLSVDDEIVHGIPGRRVLSAGQVLSIDFGASVDGYHADAAITVPIGDVDAAGQLLIASTAAALAAGIAAARPGGRLGDISHAVECVARTGGYGLPSGFGGHGIGRAMHEEPHIPNLGPPHRGLALREGLVVAIEPMLIAGGGSSHRTRPDGWTVVTADGSRAAHAEHTIALTAEGPVILTAL